MVAPYMIIIFEKKERMNKWLEQNLQLRHFHNLKIEKICFEFIYKSCSDFLFVECVDIEPLAIYFIFKTSRCMQLKLEQSRFFSSKH